MARGNTFVSNKRRTQSANAKSEMNNAPWACWSNRKSIDRILFRFTSEKAESGIRAVFKKILGTGLSVEELLPGGKNKTRLELLTSVIAELPEPSVKLMAKSFDTPGVLRGSR